MQDEVKVSQADVVRALDRAIEQIMGIEVEAMNGDNLAVTLCSHFDDPDGGELDDNGWSQAATDAYDEIKAEIAGKFVPVREAIAAFTRHRHQAERDTLARMEWRDIESAPKDGARFLAWCPYVGRVIMRIDGVHRETWAIDPSGRLGCNPTKWMPLPPAPEAGQ